ncbi:hypothetical protein ACFOMH_18910 [Paracoccus mangrovi]|uniref:Uncharacterized protein n=1 Tax=Paracoccus mangrovi TaxID=1715645 RepID=A0ABV7RC51_9RHOB
MLPGLIIDHAQLVDFKPRSRPPFATLAGVPSVDQSDDLTADRIDDLGFNVAEKFAL